MPFLFLSNVRIRWMLITLFGLMLSGCGQTIANKNVQGLAFPAVKGSSLSGVEHQLPGDFLGQKTIYLIGYVQNAQFDIDRWLIGMDMKRVTTKAYELPTIAGMVPQFFSTQIDQGMRQGIPKELWGGVITIYDDGEIVQEFTGNSAPNNARVMVIDEQGKVIFFHDRGFSVAALNEMIAAIGTAEP